MKILKKYLAIILLSVSVHLSKCIQLASESEFVEDISKNFEVEIKMKNAQITKKEQYLCTYVKLDSETQYISR